MIRYGLGSLGHCLEEFLLSGIAPVLGAGTARVDPALAVGGGYADRHVLYRSAEAGHRMPLEVGEDDGEIVVEVVRAHDVVPDVRAAFHRQTHLSLRVHDVHVGNSRESVVLSGFPVCLGVCPASAVSGVALHNSAVNLLHQVLDQGRLQEIVSARLSGGYLDGHLAGRLAAQSLIYSHQILRVYLLDHVDYGHSGGCAVAVIAASACCLVAGAGILTAGCLPIGRAGHRPCRQQGDDCRINSSSHKCRF